jgi:hypothetical protein
LDGGGRLHQPGAAAPWPSVVAHRSGGWPVLRPKASSSSELKSMRGSRGSHQGVFRAAVVTKRWRAVARIQLLSSAMARRTSKGRNQSGLRQMGAAQHRQAQRAVVVAQNTTKRRRYVCDQWLGFSSVFAKIPNESLPIYRWFAPRSCVARIRP